LRAGSYSMPAIHCQLRRQFQLCPVTIYVIQTVVLDQQAKYKRHSRHVCACWDLLLLQDMHSLPEMSVYWQQICIAYINTTKLHNEIVNSLSIRIVSSSTYSKWTTLQVTLLILLLHQHYFHRSHSSLIHCMVLISRHKYGQNIHIRFVQYTLMYVRT